MIQELAKFAKAHHPDSAEISDRGLAALFEKYKDTTLIWQDQGRIKGFAIYQEWPDRLNFIAIAGIGSRTENIIAGLAGRENLPDKMICWFDETDMELKTLGQGDRKKRDKKTNAEHLPF
ncbi:hypothetical protein ES703_34810 [subsurface metagenome]